MKECAPYKNPSDKCEGLIGEMHDVIGNINVYNIYGPCIMAMDESAQPSSLRAPLDAARAARFGDSGPNGCIDASAAIVSAAATGSRAPVPASSSPPSLPPPDAVSTRRAIST